MTTETITINIREDGSRVVVVNINNIRNAANDAASSITGLNQAMELFKKAFNAIGNFADKYFEMADAVTQLDARLRLVTKSTQDYNKAQEDMYRISQANNTGLRETASLYTKLYDPVRRLGGGAKEVGGIVEAFTATLKIGGATAGESASAILQFAQALGSGKLAGDEFRSLAENAPRFMQVLADSLDVPTGALKGLSSQGKLTADVIGNALLKNLDTLRKEATGVGNTVSGAFSDLNNDALVTVGWFDKLTGVSRSFADQIEGLALITFQFGKVLKDEVADGTKVASSGFDGMAIGMRIAGSILETILILSSDVVYVFKSIGREIGGVAAQFVAILSGNFKDAANIRGMMLEDSKNAESELKRYQDRIAQITNKALEARNAMGTGDSSADMATLSAASSDQKLFEARMRLAGITKNYYADLTALQKSYEDGKITQSEYVSSVEELAVKTYNASTAGKALAKSNKEAEAVNRKYEQSFVSLIEKIAEKDAVVKLSLTSETKLTEAEKFAAKVMEDMKNGTLGLVAARGKSVDQQKQIIAAKLNEYIIDDKNFTLQKETDKANAKSLKDIDDEIEKLQEKNIKQLESNEQIGQTKAMIDNLKTIRMMDSAASDEQTASGMRLNAIYSPESRKAIEDYADKLDKLAKAKREAAAGFTAGANKEEEKVQDDAMKKAAKKYEDAFNASSKSIEDGLYNAIGRGGEAGFKKLLTDVKSWFARLVLQPIIKPIADWGASIVTGVTGGGNASSLSSMLSSGMSLFNAGKSLSEGFSSGVGGSLGSIVTGAGNLFGSAAVSSFGTGLSLTTSQAAAAAAQYTASAAAATAAGDTALAATYTSSAGGLTGGAAAGGALGIGAGVLGGMYAGDAIANGYGNANWTATGTAAGAAIGSIIPVIGTAIGALIGGIIGGVGQRMFGHKAPEIESQGIRGNLDLTGVTGDNYANILQKGGWFSSDKRSVQSSGLNDTVDTAFDNSVKSIVASLTSLSGGIGISADRLSGFTKSFDIKLTGDATKDTEIVNKFFSDLSDELANKLVPSLKDFTVEGESATQTLTRLSTDYAGVQALLVSLGSTMQSAFGAVGEAALKSSEQLIKSAGGVDQLDSLVSSFGQNFLSAAEQLAPVQKTLTEQMTKLGYGTVTTAEQYKQAVLDLTNSGKLATKEGADTYIALLGMGPAFKAITDAAASAAKTAADKAAEAQAIIEKINQQRAGIQDKIDQLVMSPADYTTKTRADELAALDETNRALQLYYYTKLDEAEAVKVATKASEDAATALKTVMDRRSAIQDQIDSLTMTSAELLEKQRRIETAGMDEATLALIKHYYALVDQKTAADDATVATSKAAQAAKDLAAANQTVADKLLSNVRDNFATVSSIISKQKSAAAIANSAAIAGIQTLMDVAKSKLAELKSTADLLKGSLTSLRPVESGSATREAGQAQIAAALAIARAGGSIDGDSLKSALSAVAINSQDQFATLQAYQENQALIFNSVSELSDIAGVKVGAQQSVVDVLLAQKDAQQDAYEAEVARLDDILAKAQMQVDLLNGINTLLTSLPDALQALYSSISSAQANPIANQNSTITAAYNQYLGRNPEAGVFDNAKSQISNGSTIDDIVNNIKNSNEAKVQELYRTLLGRTGEAAGVDFWTKALNNGAGLATITQNFLTSEEYLAKNPVKGFADGGSFGGGLRAVGEYGMEIEATGASRIWNARQMKDAMEGGSSNSDLAEAVGDLVIAVNKLATPTQQTADNTKNIDKTLTRVTQGQDYIVVKEVTV